MANARYKIVNLKTGQEYDRSGYSSQLQIDEEIRLCNACGMNLALIPNYSMRRRIERADNQ
jgi:hypothetical protein